MIFFLKVKRSFVVFKIRPAEIDEEYIPVFFGSSDSPDIS